MANLNIRVDDELKKQAEIMFSELGMSMSTAMTVFLKQAVRFGGIPFELRVTDPFYSPENQAVLRKTIENFGTGITKPIVKTMAELEAMADE